MIQADANRKTHIDFLRGVAMIGVIFANFNSYLQQQLPPDMLVVSASRVDNCLMSFNSIFLEWKFMTLFSILFGYGFGVIWTGRMDLEAAFLVEANVQQKVGRYCLPNSIRLFTSM